MNRCLASIRGGRLTRVALYVGRGGSVNDVISQTFSYSQNSLLCLAQPSAHTSPVLERTANFDRRLPHILSRTYSSSPPSSRVRVIKSDSEFSTALDSAQGSSELAVVDFTATWCGPCRMIAPIFEKLSLELPDVSFLKVDIDEEALEQTVATAGIRVVPTFHFYKGGIKVAEVTGGDPKILTEKIDELRTSSLNGAMEKPSVLILGEQFPKMVDDLASFSTLYRHEDPSSRVPEDIAKKVRAVATSSFVGFPSALFEQLGKLEIIGNFGIGIDKIGANHTLGENVTADLKLAANHGVIVSNTPDVLTDEVADLALALMLAVSRRICEADRYVRDKKWPTEGMMPLTRKMSGKRVGIIGMGRIGAAIAKRAEAFGCPISYQSRYEKQHLPYTFFQSPTDLAKNVDFLILACPLTTETEHIINRVVLDALGPDGILINIARGPVVDEAEMVAALVEGRIGGAGLDVFEKEPHVPEELLSLPQVVLLPHVGSGSVETRTDMSDLTVANIKAHFDGKAVLTPVTK